MQPVNWTPQGPRTRVFDWPCNAFPRGQSTSNALVLFSLPCAVSVPAKPPEEAILFNQTTSSGVVCRPLNERRAE